MAHTGTPWTAEEDSLLTQAVALHGDADQWKTIALCVPGRTNKACRKRWLHSLSPAVKKTPWEAGEDAQLLALHALHGAKWSVIARGIAGRTDDACAKRYREALDPALRKDEWSAADDAQLAAAHARVGGRWAQIGAALQRSGLSCRNRWRMMERKKAAAAARSDSAPADPAPQLMHSYNAVTQTWSSAPQEPPHWTFEPAFPPPGPDAAYSALDLASFPSADTLGFPGPPPFDFAHFAMDPAFGLPPAPGPAPPHFDTPRHQGEDGHAYAYSHLIAERPPSPPPRAGSPTAIPPPPITPATSPIHGVSPADDSPRASPPPPAPESGPELSASLALLSMAASAPAAPAPSAHYRSPSARVAGKSRKPLRLNAHLAVTDDPSMRPYACGYPACWDTDAGASGACSPTSADLAEHVRAAHGAEPLAADAKPFRCALPGCGKAWKSLNGLQYHLQVSKAHFRQALAALAPEDGGGAPAAKTNKTFACPHAGCLLVYKQQSGLRYHLSRAHPDATPTQITTLPPTLARMQAR